MGMEVSLLFTIDDKVVEYMNKKKKGQIILIKTVTEMIGC